MVTHALVCSLATKVLARLQTVYIFLNVMYDLFNGTTNDSDFRLLVVFASLLSSLYQLLRQKNSRTRPVSRSEILQTVCLVQSHLTFLSRFLFHL